eukprot:jgi/Undpi1/1214/HiC_scaffold_107.g14128.m1
MPSGLDTNPKPTTSTCTLSLSLAFLALLIPRFTCFAPLPLRRESCSREAHNTEPHLPAKSNRKQHLPKHTAPTAKLHIGHHPTASMAPKLVLKYFDFEGAAEAARWALELSGLEWEDKRLSPEEFAALKPSLPYGQVPVLEIDGYVLPQSQAIIRYVGKLGGLYSSDDLGAAKCDAIIDCITDFYVNARQCITEKDQAKKVELGGDLAATFLPKWLSSMEKQLGATSGTYFSDKMSVADIMFTYLMKVLKDGILDGVPTTIVDSYPNLTALHDSVVGEPKIAAFIAKHAK